MSLGWVGCPARAWLMIMKITWRITNIITKMIWWTDVCQLPPADSLMQSPQALVIQHYLWRLLFVSDAHWGRKFSPFAKIMCGESCACWRLQGCSVSPCSQMMAAFLHVCYCAEASDAFALVIPSSVRWVFFIQHEHFVNVRQRAAHAHRNIKTQTKQGCLPLSCFNMTKAAFSRDKDHNY